MYPQGVGLTLPGKSDSNKRKIGLSSLSVLGNILLTLSPKHRRVIAIYVPRSKLDKLAWLVSRGQR